MPHTTYTVLVTIAHDHGAAPSTDLLQSMIERGLEEGVRDFAGVESATASAVVGEHMGTVRVGRGQEEAQRQISAARELHRSLRV